MFPFRSGWYICSLVPLHNKASLRCWGWGKIWRKKFNIRRRVLLVGQNCGQLSSSGQIPQLPVWCFIFCQICHISSKSDIFFQLPGTERFEEKSGERWEYKIATKLVFIQIFVLLGTSVQSDIFCRKTFGKYCQNFFAGKNCPNFTRTHSTLLRNGSTVFEV